MEPCVGIALANYAPQLASTTSSSQTVPFIPLWIGDEVHVIARHGDWGYGFVTMQGEENCGLTRSSSLHCGLFPLRLVRMEVRKCEDSRVHGADSRKCAEEMQDALLGEINAALRSWMSHLAANYAQSNYEPSCIEQCKSHLEEMLLIRNRLNASKPSAEEIRRIRRQISNRIDRGNRLAHLPLVVHNEDGWPLEGVAELSLYEAFKRHEECDAAGTNICAEVKGSDGNSMPIAQPPLALLLHSLQLTPTESRPINFDSELVLRIVRLSDSEVLSEDLKLLIDHSANPTAMPIRAVFTNIPAESIAKGDLALTTNFIGVAEFPSPASGNFRLDYAHGQIRWTEELVPPVSCKHLSDSPVVAINTKLKCIAHSSTLVETMGTATAATSKSPRSDFMSLGAKGDTKRRKSQREEANFIPLSISLQLVRMDKLENLWEQDSEGIAWSVMTWLRPVAVEPAILQDPTLSYQSAIYLQLGQLQYRCEKGEKPSIELCVSFHLDDGERVEGMVEINNSGRRFRQSEYRSKVVLCDDKPTFNETIKVLLPANLASVKGLGQIPYLRNMHARILFYDRLQRSGREPIALSHLPILKDFCIFAPSLSELRLLRRSPGEHGGYEDDASYLHALPTKSLKRKDSTSAEQVVPAPTWTVVEKASLQVVQIPSPCSGYTTNYPLLQLLRWREWAGSDAVSKLAWIHDRLVIQEGQTNDETLKHLHKALDALFQMVPALQAASARSDAFACIIHLIRVCNAQPSFQASRSLEDYVRRFHFPDVSGFLLDSLASRISDRDAPTMQLCEQAQCSRDKLLPVLKCMGTIMEFSVNSHAHRIRLRPSTAASADREFGGKVDNLLEALLRLQTDASRRMTGQNAAIKYFPNLVFTLVESRAYSPLRLSRFVVKLVEHISSNVTTHQKLSLLGEIVASPLLVSESCAEVLLPSLTDGLLATLQFHGREMGIPQKTEQSNLISLASKTLAELVELLFPLPSRRPATQKAKVDQLRMILFHSLRPIHAVLMERLDDACHKQIWALLLLLYDHFSASLFSEYADHFLSRGLDKLDMLLEMFHVLRELMKRKECLISDTWPEIKYRQDRLLLKMLSFAAQALLEEASHHQATTTSNMWEDAWVECLLATAMFSRRSIASKPPSYPAVAETEHEVYASQKKMMIINGALSLRKLWFSLRESQKVRLMSATLRPTLEVLLMGDIAASRAVVPIFLDMLHQNVNDCCTSFFGHFVYQLDCLLKYSGEQSELNGVALLQGLAACLGCGTPVQAEQLQKFQRTLHKLFELFSDRQLVHQHSESLELRIHCHVLLMNYYNKIGITTLYTSYLHQLYKFQLQLGDNVEAGMCLKALAAFKTQWINDTEAEGELESSANLTTLSSKEALYEQAIDLFIQSEYWEEAITLLEELVPVYKELLHDFKKLGNVYAKLAYLYGLISSTLRMESNYYLVVFYGDELPAFLADARKFIFRGRRLETYGSFKRRMLDYFYDFQHIDSLIFDEDEALLNAKGKKIQITPVSPQPSTSYALISANSPQPLARWYYKHHRVARFMQARSEHRSTEDNDSASTGAMEGASLWIKKKYFETESVLPTMVNFSRVIKSTEQELLNPVEVAVERIREINEKLIESAKLALAGLPHFLMTSGLIEGVIHAGVGGGLRNYEVFLTDEYWARSNVEEKKAILLLRKLLPEHITNLEYALYVHGSKTSSGSKVLHDALAEEFHRNYRVKIEKRFGKARSLLKPAECSRLSSRIGALPSGENREASVGEASTASHGDFTLSPVLFRQMLSPNAAATLIKSKLAMPGNSSKKLSARSVTMDAASPSVSPHSNSAAREIVRLSNHSNHSNLSMENECLLSCMSSFPQPPLPPRVSAYHLSELCTNKKHI